MTRKVLLVDDEPAILRVIGKRLEVSGYQVVTAQSGPEALKKVQTDRPDAIVLDLMLPGLNGAEVCAMLKQDPQYREIPVVIFTGKGRELDERLCREMGADAYVNKGPAGPLVEQLDALLSRLAPPTP
jgi:two-component system alkaline phosphatase synthesis response regulator PhoP